MKQHTIVCIYDHLKHIHRMYLTFKGSYCGPPDNGCYNRNITIESVLKHNGLFETPFLAQWTSYANYRNCLNDFGEGSHKQKSCDSSNLGF